MIPHSLAPLPRAPSVWPLHAPLPRQAPLSPRRPTSAPPQVQNAGGGEALVIDTVGRVVRPAYRSRVELHEAGHFLVAYLLGVLPRAYTLSSLDAYVRWVWGVGVWGGGTGRHHAGIQEAARSARCSWGRVQAPCEHAPRSSLHGINQLL